MSDQAIPNVFIPQFKNPLDLAQQSATLVNSLNQNQLFKSRVAAGQAFQNSIGPNGTPNQNALLQGLANSPNAAASAQESAQAGQNLQNTSQGRGIQAQTAVNQGIASLLTLPDSQLNGQVVRQKISALVQAGAISPQDAQAAESDLPPDGSPPTAYRAYSVRHLASNLGGHEQAQTILGSPVDLNSGQVRSGGVQAGVLAPGGGGAITPVGGSTPVGLPSAASASESVPTVINGPNGPVPAMTTKADILQRQGFGGVLPPQMQGGPQPGPVTGRYPSAPPGTVVTGVPAGAAGAAEITAGANAKQGVQLAQTADQVPSRKGALDNMLSDLQTLDTGPGADWEKTANALSTRLGGFGITMSPKQVADQENFAKFSKQLALAQTSSLGAGTDEKLMTSLGSNPNTDLSKLGNQQIIGMLKGNEDAISLKNLAWQKYQQVHGPQSYGTFSTQFNQGFDPRALQAVYMSPADKATLAARLNADPLAKARFVNTLKMGMGAGIIQAPGSANGR